MIEAKSAVDAARVIGVLGLIHRREAAQSESELALCLFVR
jgi:hypothetical protein